MSASSLRIFILMIFAASVAEAKIFNFGNESFATYLLGSAGGSLLRQNQVENESGAGTKFDDEIKYNFAGEIGFLYSTQYVNFRFGFEVLKPAALKATASNAAGTALYDVKSDLTGIVPKLGIEFNIRPLNNYRGFVLLSAGAATLTMKNDYVMTTAGLAAYPGVVDHTVETKANSTELTAAVGMETYLSDSSTWVFEAGYRQLNFKDLKYSKSATTFTGSNNAGDPVKDSSGQNRALNFSGMIINLGLRIYL